MEGSALYFSFSVSLSFFFFWFGSVFHSSPATGWERRIIFSLNLWCASVRSTLWMFSPRRAAVAQKKKTPKAQMVWRLQDKSHLTLLNTVLLTLILICVVLIRQVHVVEYSCLTVQEDWAWPYNFPDMKYRKEGRISIADSKFILSGSVIVNFCGRVVTRSV